jgi:DNA-binding transcriptional regulator GbsR (MarR family)
VNGVQLEILAKSVERSPKLSMTQFISSQTVLYQQWGYSALEGRILATLCLAPQALSLGQLASRLKVSKVMVSRAVNRLTSIHVLTVQRHASSRQHFVSLPEAGLPNTIAKWRSDSWQQARLIQGVLKSHPRLHSRLEPYLHLQLRLVATLDGVLEMQPLVLPQNPEIPIHS